MTSEVTILTLNIASPSRKRADSILAWLDARDDDVLVLTETCHTEGTAIIAQHLDHAGWEVRNPVLAQGERGVMLASRVVLDPPTSSPIDYLPSRVQTATISGIGIDVIGVYIPSRDATNAKIQRKRAFVEALARTLGPAGDASTVLVGDFNILEPDHWPRRPEFHEWEYRLYTDLVDAGWTDAYRATRTGAIEHSWVSPDGDGYRFDHAFVAGALGDRILGCRMLHDPRKSRLSDHSALELRLAVDPPARLPELGSLVSDPLALF